MKKYLALVSFAILAACQAPTEYGLHGQTVDMACHGCDENKPKQAKVEPVQRELVVAQETRVIDTNQYRDEQTTIVVEQKPYGKMQSNNQVKGTYLFIEGTPAVAPKKPACGMNKNCRHQKPACKQPACAKKRAQDCDCSKPCVKKKQSSCEKRECTSNITVPLDSPIKQIAQETDGADLSQDQINHNKVIADLRKRNQ
ncbi:MAG: hypothetical protein LBR35_01010, partial [Rickettsiales bacterium]|nr:hypothetical protein [Rickettsiales bacterium]